MVKVKLLKSVLVGDTDVMSTKHGTVVELPADRAKEFVSLGLAEEVKAKAEPDDKRAKGK